MDTSGNSVFYQRLQILREFKADIKNFMEQTLEEFQQFATDLIQDMKRQLQQQQQNEGGERMTEMTTFTESPSPPKQECSPSYLVMTSNQDFVPSREKVPFGKEDSLFILYSRKNSQSDYQNLWITSKKSLSSQDQILKNTGFGQEIWKDFPQELNKWMGEIPTG